MKNIQLLSCLVAGFIFVNIPLFVSAITVPTILEIKEDDRVATIYWNSKTDTYHNSYDPDKQEGIYSYLVEWGKVSEGFTKSDVTPYRVFMAQPLEPGIMYQVRVSALDTLGNKSAPSSVMQFQHDDTRVLDMANRLTGFFDDFNQSMGAFDETKWNQSYSGCMKIGWVSQHINPQFHGHNVIASDECDRGVASSRARSDFDFTGRTGVIEFDLDGSKLGRNFWYLDLSPATRKRDLTGHTALETNGVPPQSDPAHLLRFVEFGDNISIQLADASGNLHTVGNIYQNGACGNLLEYCSGENLIPVPNVRRHWRIELSKTTVKVFINSILVIDGSLVTTQTPNGLPYEVAQVNWLFFSYNTSKENAPLTMVHWDNFGFDAPAGYTPAEVVHNYTDGVLGTNVAPVGNEKSAGAVATLSTPAQFSIPIPDPIQDLAGNMPIGTELMFTMQGSTYSWTAGDYILVNGTSYSFPEPTSAIPGFPGGSLINTTKPYSAILDLDPADLIIGDNEIDFYLNDARLLNVHIELTYPVAQAPSYSPPASIHAGYMGTLMNFYSNATVGPGIIFDKIDGIPLWQSEFQRISGPQGGVAKLVKQTPVSGIIDFDLFANSNARLAATGHAVGISYYEVWMNQQVVQTINVDNDEAVAAFKHEGLQLNTANYSDGVHELFLQAYDKDGNVSAFDVFLGNVQHGEYVPVEFTIQNSALPVELLEFQVQKIKKAARLNWSTATEENNAGFEIQRSSDGDKWVKIGFVKGAGSTSTVQHYHFMDDAPFFGINYYRLKQMDISGTEFQYSPVRMVEVNHFGESQLAVFPNPAKQQVNVQFNESIHGADLILADIHGKAIFTVKNIGPKHTFSVEDLPKGVYFIFIRTQGSFLTERVLIE